MSVLILHKGESKPLSFATTGSFLGKDVEFRIGKRVSTRELTETAVFALTVAEDGETATGEAIIDEDVISGTGYESQLVIINDADDTDFEVVDGPLVTIKETI